MRDIDRILEKYGHMPLPKPKVFNVKTANAWIQEAAQRPTPKKLFGSLWLEGELSILYADTGIGKTILAMQIAHNISSGKQFPHLENQTEAQPVLYLDFELTDKQFQMRYTTDNTPYSHLFNENFLRAEICLEDVLNEQMIMEAIEAEVVTKQVNVLVVDNITYLNGETEKGRNALPLMKHLNRLKKDYGLSILVLAHTPKRDESRAIMINDLYGSKMISNFIDGAFAMGRSHDAPNLRYIKQVKCRSSETEYHADNVILVELVKDECMTLFNFVDFSNERIHLKQLSETEDTNLSSRILELSEKGYSQRKIAAEIGRSVGCVNYHLKGKS